MAKKKTWTYYRSGKMLLKDGTATSFATQLYQIGVYLIIDNNSALQGGTHPKNMERLVKDWEKKKEEGATILWGSSITVTEEDGFFEEVTQ